MSNKKKSKPLEFHFPGNVTNLFKAKNAVFKSSWNEIKQHVENQMKQQCFELLPKDDVISPIMKSTIMSMLNAYVYPTMARNIEIRDADSASLVKENQNLSAEKSKLKSQLEEVWTEKLAVLKEKDEMTEELEQIRKTVQSIDEYKFRMEGSAKLREEIIEAQIEQIQTLKMISEVMKARKIFENEEKLKSEKAKLQDQLKQVWKAKLDLLKEKDKLTEELKQSKMMNDGLTANFGERDKIVARLQKNDQEFRDLLDQIISENAKLKDQMSKAGKAELDLLKEKTTLEEENKTLFATVDKRIADYKNLHKNVCDLAEKAAKRMNAMGDLKQTFFTQIGYSEPVETEDGKLADAKGRQIRGHAIQVFDKLLDHIYQTYGNTLLELKPFVEEKNQQISQLIEIAEQQSELLSAKNKTIKKAAVQTEKLEKCLLKLTYYFVKKRSEIHVLTESLKENQLLLKKQEEELEEKHDETPICRKDFMDMRADFQQMKSALESLRIRENTKENNC